MSATIETPLLHLTPQAYSSNSRRRTPRRTTKPPSRRAYNRCPGGSVHAVCPPSSDLEVLMTMTELLPAVQQQSQALTVSAAAAAVAAAGMATPLNLVRSSSPKAVISESSPIKKRRVDGFCSVDYRHRRGSRSGDLALLRVLSAPPSPLSASFHPLGSRQAPPSPSCKKPKPRTRTEQQRIHLFQRPVSPLKNRNFPPSALQSESIDLRKDHYVFPKPQTRPERKPARHPSAQTQTTAPRNATPITSAAPATSTTPTSTTSEAITKIILNDPGVSSALASNIEIMEHAEDVAGPTAVYCKKFIPLCCDDDVASFFNPEMPVVKPAEEEDKDAATAEGEQPSASTSQLPAVIGPDASLRQNISALPAGQSLLFVYPTRAGAQAFTDTMLMPVLDPLLRRAVNTHGLADESARQIRQACRGVADDAFSFDELKETVGHIMAAASNDANTEDNSTGNDNGNAGGNGGNNAVFEQRLAERTDVRVSATAWKNAWIDQARGMVRRLIEQGLRGHGGGEKVDFGGIMAPMGGTRVAEELLADLRKHKFDDWETGPEADQIEVALFVISRQQ